jgi:hypothetical protein
MFTRLPVLAAFGSLMLFAAPAFAQMAAEPPMAPASAMGADDHMAMAPMSANEKKLMAACHKMTPAKAAKNARCAALMKKHGDHAMGHAM